MDVRQALHDIMAEAILSAFGDSIPTEEAAALALVEMPRDDRHGDLASSAALKLARPLKTAPLAIAGALADRLKCIAKEKLPGLLADIDVLPPGFINFHLGPAFFRDLVTAAAAGGYGRSDLGKGRKVNVEFVSANPTGPLTVAHGRQAAVGDALSNILEYAGFSVAREYYLNDTGGQVRRLGASVFSHYAAAAGSAYPFPDDGYHGGYIAEVASDLFAREGKSLLSLDEEAAIEEAGRFAAEEITGWIKRDLDSFRVPFDIWSSQRELESSGAADRLMESLRGKGLVYERDGAVWLKVGDYGDEKDRVVVKSDGDYTYRTPDIAYHENKFGRGFDMLIDILGPDHHGHIITMEAAMRAVGHPVESFHGLIVQFCTLWRGSDKLKMSTRAGDFVTLREVIDEVGIDAARYFFAARKTDSPLDFDLELARRASMDNPVYYIQYMSARLSGVVETALTDERFASDIENGLFLPEEIDLDPLGAPEEPMLRAVFALPVVIEKAAETLEQHRLCGWLYEMAGLFHHYYAGNRFVSEDTAASRARLYMASALKVLLDEMLSLIGVSAPEKM